MRRTASDRKGGHFARRKADGRIVLRETAQTLDADQDGARRPRPAPVLLDQQPVVRPRRDDARRSTPRQGILGLPLIRNVKHLDPADPSTPEVIQIETAMGAAIEVFEGARTIEVGRDRFVPVKTTNDLLVLRSDVYDLGQDFVLDQASDEVPFVDLDGDFYKLVGDFDKRFPEGAPSLREATSLVVDGDCDLRPRRAGRRRRRARAPLGASAIAAGTVLVLGTPMPDAAAGRRPRRADPGLGLAAARTSRSR